MNELRINAAALEVFQLRTDRLRTLRAITNSRPRSVGLAIVAVALGIASLQAENIPVPNGSFELPSTPFADPRVDSWQKSAKPVWFEENPAQSWDQLTGVFANTDPGKEDHIDNMDGNQGLFLFALPEVALFQDYDSTDWTNSTPTHAFNPAFEVGKSYRLTVALVGGGGGMLEGVSLQAGLYYRDNASNQVLVASTNVAHSAALFTNTTHFVDFSVDVPAVEAGDPWAGQHIGIQLLSTVAPNQVGGYWDIDNVRLTSDPDVASGPSLLMAHPSLNGGAFTLTLQGAIERRVEILMADEVSLPLTNWVTLGTVTNLTGTVPFTDMTAGQNRRFYRARQVD